MNDDCYFSVRMRASWSGQHVGGAERLTEPQNWPQVVSELSHRAQAYPTWDEVSVTSELIDARSVVRTTALPVSTLPFNDVQTSRRVAVQLLVQSGIPRDVALQAMSLLDEGPAPGGRVMRGAVLMSAVDGRRLERDPARGVRASRMDYTPECRAELADWMSTAGLKSNRFVEALAVATKVAWSGVAAEICWSDDPTYAPGYVASPRFGYCRFPRLKALGTALGGRVFFLVDLSHSLEVIRRLEHCPLLIDRLSKEAPPFPVLDEVL